MKPNEFKGKSLYYMKLKLSCIKFRLKNDVEVEVAYVAAFSLIQHGIGYLQYPGILVPEIHCLLI